TAARQALTADADGHLGGLGISDPEGVIDRLRSSGVVTDVEDEVRGTLLKVPTLLAATLRRDLDSAAGPVVASLLDVLIEHMESTGTLEAELLGDVLLLARSGGHWSQLLRIAEAVGIPLFLRAPRSSCPAFRLRPPRARAAGPGLEFFGTLAEDIASSADGCGADGIRAAAVAQTGPGLQRSRLPGAGAGIDSVDSIADVVGRWEQRGESLIAIRSMIGLADAGRHVAAGSVGMAARPRVRSVRPRPGATAGSAAAARATARRRCRPRPRRQHRRRGRTLGTARRKPHCDPLDDRTRRRRSSCRGGLGGDDGGPDGPECASPLGHQAPRRDRSPPRS